jgi:hypothetical protein
MDRRQLPAVVFLTMSTATMCVAARPVHAAAAALGHGARAARPGAVREIRRAWENPGKIAIRMSLDIPQPAAKPRRAACHPTIAAVPVLGGPDQPSRPGRS